MTTKIDLKRIEEKTRASYFEDGFWDIGVGLLVLTTSSLVLVWFSAGEVTPWWWGFIPLAIIVMPAIARRCITYPRIGQFKLHWMPSGSRGRKLLYVTCVATAILLIFVGLLFYRLSYDFARIPDEAGGFILGTGWLLFFAAFGYFWGYRLMYAYGLLVAVSTAIERSVDSPAGEIMMYACGALMVVVGLARTIRFFRKYPKASVKDTNTNGPG